MKRLVLIDGHAILHRAFHALPPNFTTPAGEPSNAVYGFSTMMLRILEDLKPDYLVVAFDLPAPTFRMQAYTQYQSKRPDMDGNLKGQITLTHEMLNALEIPYFEIGGFEADDCIGSLAVQASREGIETYIVTGDRDMLQLASDKVKIYVPIKGLSETKTYDAKLVMEEFGVKPSQWVDVKALKGDASDNYPGVVGIGPKTACDLIAKYDTLENLYRHLGDLSENTAKKLAEGTESAGMGKKLATIVTDVPGVDLDLEASRVDKVDWESGVKYMKASLGFRTIVERIEKSYLSDESHISRVSDKKDKKGKDKVSENKNEQQMKLIV